MISVKTQLNMYYVQYVIRHVSASYFRPSSGFPLA